MSIVRLAGEPVLDSIVDGPGLRMSVFFQGCPHKCKGCHNPETWSFVDGFDKNIEEIKALMLMHKDIYRGITFSGGEPIQFGHMEQLIELCEYAHEIGWDVWLYTGYTYDIIIEEKDIPKLFSYINVLVEGPFILAQRSLDCKWRGSTNQRIIDVPASLAQNKVILATEFY